MDVLQIVWKDPVLRKPMGNFKSYWCVLTGDFRSIEQYMQ